MGQQGSVMNRRHQTGMSMWSMALIALVAGFFCTGRHQDDTGVPE